MDHDGRWLDAGFLNFIDQLFLDIHIRTLLGNFIFCPNIALLGNVFTGRMETFIFGLPRFSESSPLELRTLKRNKLPIERLLLEVIDGVSL